jgi:hypothetical protein
MYNTKGKNTWLFWEQCITRHKGKGRLSFTITVKWLHLQTLRIHKYLRRKWTHAVQSVCFVEPRTEFARWISQLSHFSDSADDPKCLTYYVGFSNDRQELFWPVTFLLKTNRATQWSYKIKIHVLYKFRLYLQEHIRINSICKEPETMHSRQNFMPVISNPLLKTDGSVGI